jgi:hypothetical protein
MDDNAVPCCCHRIIALSATRLMISSRYVVRRYFTVSRTASDFKFRMYKKGKTMRKSTITIVPTHRCANSACHCRNVNHRLTPIPIQSDNMIYLIIFRTIFFATCVAENVETVCMSECISICVAIIINPISIIRVRNKKTILLHC